LIHGSMELFIKASNPPDNISSNDGISICIDHKNMSNARVLSKISQFMVALS
jgi:hypothetical protein